MKTTREVTFLLLVLQAALGFLTSLGPIVLALGGAPANAILAFLAITLSVAQLVLAALLLRGSRRAATWLIGYEALCLTGAALAAWIHLGADDRFAPVITNLGLPILLLVLLLRLRTWSADEDRNDRLTGYLIHDPVLLGGGVNPEIEVLPRATTPLEVRRRGRAEPVGRKSLLVPGPQGRRIRGGG
jgi:hypothetical protein